MYQPPDLALPREEDEHGAEPAVRALRYGARGGRHERGLAGGALGADDTPEQLLDEVIVEQRLVHVGDGALGWLRVLKKLRRSVG